MSKLVCTEHGRRVMVLSAASVIHRENGKPCDTTHVRQGTQTHTPSAVAARRAAFEAGIMTPEGRLLMAIFGAPEVEEAE